jgi:hypothetical protein
MGNEFTTRAPTLPLILWINGAVLDFYFGAFKRKYLTGYDVVEILQGITPDTPGADPMAHGLEKLFNLYRGGNLVSKEEQNAVYSATVCPAWPGLTSISSEGIRVSLTPSLTPATSMYAGAVTTMMVGGRAKKFFSNHKG